MPPVGVALLKMLWLTRLQCQSAKAETQMSPPPFAEFVPVTKCFCARDQSHVWGGGKGEGRGAGGSRAWPCDNTICTAASLQKFHSFPNYRANKSDATFGSARNTSVLTLSQSVWSKTRQWFLNISRADVFFCIELISSPSLARGKSCPVTLGRTSLSAKVAKVETFPEELVWSLFSSSALSPSAGALGEL